MLCVFLVSDMRKVSLSILFFLVSFQLIAQLSNRVANYDINVSLDVDSKMLTADTRMSWKNISNNAVDELQFHIYYNAFKNSKSTFMRDRGLGMLSSDGNKCNWGYTDIVKMEDQYGNDLTGNMEYLNTTDENTDDQTVLRVTLAKPVLPNETVVINFDWKSKVPRTMPRTGYNKDYYFMVQWFPKLGVYEPAGMRYATEGAWNCHQYHSSGEYYSDFGVYNVNITVPNGYVVGASGELIEKKEEQTSTTWSYRVEDVIDFAWTTSPHFVVQEEKWKHVDIKLYTYECYTNCSDRYFKTIRYTLDYLDRYVGRYPYSTITIVDPPIHGLFTGGMEYPTLISSLSFCFFPKGFKTAETLTVHEFIHQYFMQMVATHEQDEPWMDEGITTYYEGRILDALEGEKTSFIDWMGLKIGNEEYNRGEFFAGNPKIAPNTFKSRDFKHGGYGPVSYNKTAVWLKTLEGIVGIATVDKIMQTYFEKWKFKHPARQDFIDVTNEVVIADHGEEYPDGMDWYFEQVLYGTDICDYKLLSITNRKAEDELGYLEGYSNCYLSSEIEEDQDTYYSKVVVQRMGELKLPIEILVKFEDGSEELLKWNGIDRSTEFNFQGTQKLIEARIDPDQKIYLDNNFLNNGYTVAEQKTGVRKYFFQLVSFTQEVIEGLSFFI